MQVGPRPRERGQSKVRKIDTRLMQEVPVRSPILIPSVPSSNGPSRPLTRRPKGCSPVVSALHGANGPGGLGLVADRLMPSPRIVAPPKGRSRDLTQCACSQEAVTAALCGCQERSGNLLRARKNST